jgi:hypothetical protein
MDHTPENLAPAPEQAARRDPAPVRETPPTHAPLTESDLTNIEAVGQRLRGEIARLVAWLPPASRSVRGMAARLNVDRNTCQRLLAATRPSTHGTDVFFGIPGVRALMQFVDAVRAAGAPEELCAGLAAATSSAATVLDSASGSLTTLRSLIESAREERLDDPTLGNVESRRRQVTSSAKWLGKEVRSVHLISAVRQMPDDASKVEQAWIRGLIGLRARPGSAPISLGLASTDRSRSPGDAGEFWPLAQASEPGAPRVTILKSLSSEHLPTVTSRASTGSVVTVIDPTLTPVPDPVDVVTATRISHIEHPLNSGCKVFHTSIVTANPTHRLVFDVYLHRDLAMASVPSAGCYLYSMSMSDDPDQNWPFLLPVQTRMEVLGTDPSLSTSPAWSRHSEASRHLFEKTGWKPRDYTGYRIDLEHPPWGSTIVMWFDFRRPEA